MTETGTRASRWLAAATCSAGRRLAGVGAGSTAGNASPSFRPAPSPACVRPLGRAPGVPTRAHRSGPQCGISAGLLCSTVVVPLDRTGSGARDDLAPRRGPPGARHSARRDVPDRRRAGPGLGARLRSRHAGGRQLYRFLFPGYTLVAYDDRGTGDSGPDRLPCAPERDHRRPAARRGRRLRQRRSARTRAFYSTAEHAEDLEAVRQALGFDKIALYGVSYGTKLALAYALAHPDHVERLAARLGAASGAARTRTARTSCATLPATLNAFCSDGGCRAATSDFAGRRRRGREQLAAKPLQRQGADAERQDRRRSGSTGSSSSRRCSTPTSTPASPRSCPRSSTPRGSGTPSRCSGSPASTTWRLGPRRPIELSFAPVRSDGLPRRPVPVGAGHAGRAPALRSCSAAVRCAPGRDVRPVRELGGPLRQRRLLPRLAEPVRRRRPRPRAAAERADARGQRRLRHAHPDRERRLGRRALPAGPAARRPRRRPQHRRRPTRRPAPHARSARWIPGRHRAARSARAAKPIVRTGPGAACARHRRSRSRGGPLPTYAIAAKTMREAEAAWLMASSDVRSRASTAASSSRRRARVHAHALLDRAAACGSAASSGSTSTDLPFGLPGDGDGRRRRRLRNGDPRPRRGPACAAPSAAAIVG